MSAPRRSPGKDRADALRERAEGLRERAASAGNQEAWTLADHAIAAAMNSRSGYEAASGMSGGSSRAFSLRSRGARWLTKGRKLADQAEALLTGVVQ